MTPLAVLKAAVTELEKRQVEYCLIGGHAASLYRINERVTVDVDFALVAKPASDSRAIAEEIIRAVGLNPMVGFIPGRRNQNKSGKICLVTSEPEGSRLNGIIDILLPELPWLTDAVTRAQLNRIDLGFDKVPIITPEDLIIAKCYALSGSPDRFQDLDDIREIFRAVNDLDFEYLARKLDQFSLVIPKILKPSLPGRMKRFTKARN